MRAIHELKNGTLKNYRGKKNLKFRDYTQKPQNHSTDKTKTKIIFIPILGGKRYPNPPWGVHGKGTVAFPFRQIFRIILHEGNIVITEKNKNK